MKVSQDKGQLQNPEIGASVYRLSGFMTFAVPVGWFSNTGEPDGPGFE
ncbi:MAG: hypothetical protein AAGH40_12865 [Verrucomicrobiota bacterium]